MIINTIGHFNHSLPMSPIIGSPY